ncbi:MAG: NifB/NifX family molybdenum-iron cluster-binding protein [Candidatus Omnitrophica bacterium]|nr:NifB/NifX family molybdenum-iron cluster-binding protein [Candidatus Omnitrophota bacterium]MBU4488507.1 NifB/NifX family molybdenum-iron cluster-binding protein [Candidatus Omnitrophota bacterium]MCG2704581.1 NifB/NifX family molybdenum-iron cluster-binding protein [Candidatus Omnitrophota bacterium]
MRICIPTEIPKDKNTVVYGHLERAPFFTIYDSEKHTFTSHPMGALDGKNVDIVICGGMSADALQKLNEAGVRVYIASSGTVEEVIKKYKQDKLEEITVENSRNNLHCC